MTNSIFFQLGGSLKARDNSYVFREADPQLYEFLLEGKLCYISNARQMGKSSLINSTIAKLRNEGIICAFIYLPLIITQELLDEEKQNSQQIFYQTLILALKDELVKRHNFEFNWREFSQDDDIAKVTSSLKFKRFIDLVLNYFSSSEKIVLFFDEIDKMRDLPFPPDDFLHLIRDIYQEYRNRITFVFVGVRKPNDLIKNSQLMSFNIGESVDLRPFTLQQAKVLTQGLQNLENPEQSLTEILKYSGGQPYLTQRLCQLLVENSHCSMEELITSKITGNDWNRKDTHSHLDNIQNLLLKDNFDKETNKFKEDLTDLEKGEILNILDLYNKILNEKKIKSEGTSIQNELKLAGIVCEDPKNQEYLKIYNPIYEEVFNQEWLNQKIAQLRLSYNEEFRQWLYSGKDDEFLLCSEKLKEVEEWAKDKMQYLTDVDKEFIKTSSRKQKDKQKQRILRSITLILLTIFGAWGVLQHIKNQQNKQQIAIRHTQGEKLIQTWQKDECTLQQESIINLKQEGVQLYRSEEFDSAQAKFAEVLEKTKDSEIGNDPEIQTYYNNSWVGNKPSYLIAVPLPISNNCNTAKEMLRGATQAQKKVNENGGIKDSNGNNVFIKIMIVDDANNPNWGRKLAEKFPELEVIAVVGHNATDAWKEAVEIYQKNKILLITPTSSVKDNPQVIYQVAKSTLSESTLMTETMLIIAQQNKILDINLQKPTKILLCLDYKVDDNKALNEEIKEGVINLDNIEATIEVGGIKCDLSPIDKENDQTSNNQISSVITEDDAKKLVNPDIISGILLVPGVDNIRSIVPLICANAELEKPLPLFNLETMYTKETFDLAKENGCDIEGMLIAVSWHPTPKPQGPEKTFIEDAMKLLGKSIDENITWRTAMSYDALNTVAKALENVPYDNIKNIRENLVKEINKEGFECQEAVTGSKVSFDNDGQRKQDTLEPDIVEVFQDDQSKTSYSWRRVLSQ